MNGNYITVHDKRTRQSNFTQRNLDGNGIAILQPTVCRITEVLNGTYELYLEHPANDYDPRSRAIQADNIIKADGQLFRIRKVSRKLSQNGEKVITANALHIWYDLADRYIQYYNADGFAPWWCLQGIISNQQEEIDQDLMPTFDFEGTTSCGSAEPLAYAHYKDANVVSCLIGTENAFVSIYQKEIDGVVRTPELYRDNFKYQLDWRKFDAVDNAFNITHRIDMTDVTEIFDIQDLVTRLTVRDNYGHSRGFRIVPAEIIAAGGWLPAHHRTKTVELQYNSDENNADIEWRFNQDAERYWNQVSSIKLSYKCNFAELSNTELYKDYIAAKHCNVGDTGTIICESLGITATNMKVIKKVKDVLKGETISLEFGTKSASLTDPQFMRQTINTSKFTPT